MGRGVGIDTTQLAPSVRARLEPALQIEPVVRALRAQQLADEQLVDGEGFLGGPSLRGARYQGRALALREAAAQLGRIDPNQPLQPQLEAVEAWIRERFDRAERREGKPGDRPKPRRRKATGAAEGYARGLTEVERLLKLTRD